MGDPAIDAAERSVAKWRSTLPEGEFPEASGMYDTLASWATEDRTDAAREALSPVRELHKRWDRFDGPVCQECEGGTQEWPCATARLIYSDDELTEASPVRTTWVDEDLGNGRSISRGFGGCATCDDGGCGDCAEEGRNP